jgi:glycosyltransferase involved in cell wall biosynthesis
MGVVLQKWILKHLRMSSRIACVSKLTLSHLCEVAGESTPKPGWKVVHNAFNAPFARVETGAANRILARNGISIPQPFLLHVGSDLPRKNRRMLVQMIGQGKVPWPGHICFAGDPIEPALSGEARTLGVQDRLHSIVKPEHQTLCALYSLAEALVFPSFSEGFGWPVIEAQACGTPVIASNREPLPEVSGGAALHADPESPQEFAAALQKLNEAGARKSLIEQGLKNAERFGVAKMIEGYLTLHDLDAASFPETAPKNA